MINGLRTRSGEGQSACTCTYGVRNTCIWSRLKDIRILPYSTPSSHCLHACLPFVCCVQQIVPSHYSSSRSRTRGLRVMWIGDEPSRVLNRHQLDDEARSVAVSDSDDIIMHTESVAFSLPEANWARLVMHVHVRLALQANVHCEEGKINIALVLNDSPDQRKCSSGGITQRRLRKRPDRSTRSRRAAAGGGSMVGKGRTSMHGQTRGRPRRQTLPPETTAASARPVFLNRARHVTSGGSHASERKKGATRLVVVKVEFPQSGHRREWRGAAKL